MLENDPYCEVHVKYWSYSHLISKEMQNKFVFVTCTVKSASSGFYQVVSGNHCAKSSAQVSMTAGGKTMKILFKSINLWITKDFLACHQWQHQYFLSAVTYNYLKMTGRQAPVWPLHSDSALFLDHHDFYSMEFFYLV